MGCSKNGYLVPPQRFKVPNHRAYSEDFVDPRSRVLRSKLHYSTILVGCIPYYCCLNPPIAIVFASNPSKSKFSWLNHHIIMFVAVLIRSPFLLAEFPFAMALIAPPDSEALQRGYSKSPRSDSP